MAYEDIRDVCSDGQTLYVEHGNQFPEFVYQFTRNEDPFSRPYVCRGQKVIGISLHPFLVGSKHRFLPFDFTAGAGVTEFCMYHLLLEFWRTLLIDVPD